MRKLLFILLILLALLSITAVSANDNATDIVMKEDNGVSLEEMEDNGDEIITQKQDTGADVVNANESSSSVTKTSSKIQASNIKGYESFTTTLKIKLTSNGTILTSKPVKIVLNDITYNKKTDKNGEVNLKLSLSKGEYEAKITYDGDNLTKKASKTCKITIDSPIKTTLKIVDKNINYRQGSKCLFYVKLQAGGKGVKNQVVTFKVAGKTYTAKTNKYGNAKIFLNLKKGTHKVKYSFKKNAPYLSSSGSFKIKVKAKMSKGNGYWLWSSHMKSINLKSLAKKGTKHILLHAYALTEYGKSSVVSFIKKAHRYGMKVHLWMQVCYTGKWVSPMNKKTNTIKYGFLNAKIKEALRYSKIPCVDGVHFDYVRFGGTAHLYKNAEKSINYFIKHAAVKIHKARPNCIVSAALMPEPSMMSYYYGQDVPTMSKYLDSLIPMVYKGNYHQKTSWIKSVTKTFTVQSNGAQIWTGLQSYHSDSNVAKLTQSSLLKDAKAAKKGGAYGVILFRYGISCNFNFKKV